MKHRTTFQRIKADLFSLKECVKQIVFPIFQHDKDSSERAAVIHNKCLSCLCNYHGLARFGKSIDPYQSLDLFLGQFLRLLVLNVS